MDPRTRRIAQNESRFREINERLEADLRRVGVRETEHAEFVCECGMADCAMPVPLTIAEYERVRADPLLFAVVPGHELPDVEDVMERNERFAVVRKGAESASLVERTDPRS